MALTREIKAKIVKELFIQSQYDCNVTIKTTDFQKTYFVKGHKKPQRIRVGIRGKLIGIDITADDKADIVPPTLRVGLEV